MLYACDKPWWKEYHAQVRRTWQGGECFSVSTETCKHYPVRLLPSSQERDHHLVPPGEIRRGLNSGYQALGMAVLFGARRVVLLGYDHQKTGGRAHCHPDHPRGMGNLGTLADWIHDMNVLARWLDAQGVEVINATRQTALRCFARRPLPEALNP